LIFNKTRPK